MSRVTYAATSPYSNTDQVNIYLEYLDTWVGSYIGASSSDTILTLTTKYQHRPDLLSYDSYGTPAYWWIFAMRNPDQIRDPIYDMKAGMTIAVPVKENLPRGGR